MKLLNGISIRTRLLVVYVSIILIGIGGVAIIAGEQVTSAAQVDYGQRLQNEITLVAQGIGPTIQRHANGEINQAELDMALQNYATEANGKLTLYAPTEDAIYVNENGKLRDLVELKGALKSQVTLTQRLNNAGVETFYTAAPVVYEHQMIALIQLAVPVSNLHQVVTERWLELALLVALIAATAIIAALLLAQSILQPLYKLRESALRLSQGDFSHRIAYEGKDEMSEFAHTFNEMAQQVESMLEEQRAFASNASHELRTPLTTIRQGTEALRYDSTLDQATSKHYIEQIDEEVIRLGNLVEELSLLSRFDSGRLELGQEEVDIHRFAANLQQQMMAQAQDKHIQITLTLPNDAAVLNVRIDHLMVVFRNLLDNAIKYTPEGGTITWNIQKSELGISSQICDSGIGIDAIHLPHLFERFYRADKAHSRAIPGTGLGLALVKSIVEAYGGQVSIESPGLNQGTLVSIFWPYLPG